MGAVRITSQDPEPGPPPGSSLPPEPEAFPQSSAPAFAPQPQRDPYGPEPVSYPGASGGFAPPQPATPYPQPMPPAAPQTGYSGAVPQMGFYGGSPPQPAPGYQSYPSHPSYQSYPSYQSHPPYPAAQGYPFPPPGAYAPLFAPPPAPRVSRRAIFASLATVGVAVVAFIGAIAFAAPTGGTTSRPSTGAVAQDESLRSLWRTAAAGDLLPSTLNREGTETYIRLGVDPDETCAHLPVAFTAALSPAACSRAVEATYVDRTQTVTATVGIVVLSGTPGDRLRLFQTWTSNAYSTKDAMMPHAYPVAGTLAAQFGDAQRVTWQSQVSTDGTYLVYAVTGFTDGRSGPDASARASNSGSALSTDSPAVQVAGDLPTAIQIILTAKETAAAAGGSAS